jgi:prepilin-type N-terminal cleavage/methylation domain-containing protein
MVRETGKFMIDRIAAKKQRMSVPYAIGRKSESGFTMIELVIAILLLGLISTMIIGAVNISSSSTRSVSTAQDSRSIAELQMEYIKRQNYNNVSYNVPAPAIASYPDYSVVLPITPENINGRDGNIQKITVTVIYKSPGLAGIAIINGGTNYSSPPSVTISGGGGSGATAEAVVSGGSVTAINITNSGSGYTSSPNVNIAPPSGGGTQATASASRKSAFILEGYKVRQ